MSERAQILVRHGVDLKTFREELVTARIPPVMKDLVADWPAVRAGRFTRFPPDPLQNLYMGPVDFTPSGTPISLVPVNDRPHAASAFRFFKEVR